jgi:hypothetical protein
VITHVLTCTRLSNQKQLCRFKAMTNVTHKKCVAFVVSEGIQVFKGWNEVYPLLQWRSTMPEEPFKHIIFTTEKTIKACYDLCLELWLSAIILLIIQLREWQRWHCNIRTLTYTQPRSPRRVAYLNSSRRGKTIPWKEDLNPLEWN